MESIDYSLLPDVVWVNILFYLAMTDRAHTALASHRLNDMFHHPALWYNARIMLVADAASRRQMTGARAQHDVKMPKYYESMINKVGCYIRNLTLIVYGFVAKINKECLDLLVLLGETSRLETLTLRIGDSLSASDHDRYLSLDCLNKLATLITSACRLKNLNIETWPMSRNDEVGFDLLSCICNNEKLTRLEKFSFFCQTPSADSWITKNILYPTQKSVNAMIKHCRALKSLRLRSEMINNAVLVELSNTQRAAIEKIGIIITPGGLPDIENSTWRALRQTSPQLVVDLIVAHTLPTNVLLDALRPGMPLRSVTFLKYVRYHADILTHLGANYNQTLVEFIDYDDDGRRNDELVSFVNRCTRLKHFNYSGRLRSSTVIALARARAESWEVFHIKASGIDVLSCVVDEDEVIRDAGNGVYEIVGHQPGSQFYHTDESEYQQATALDGLVTHVSELLHRRWTPSE